MEGNKPAYLHPQHTGHCLFVTRYFELNPSPMRFSLVNLFSRLGLVMAKGVINFCVTEGRDCYARYHYSKRETSSDAEVVKYHYHTRRANKPNGNNKDPCSLYCYNIFVSEPQYQGKKSVHTDCSQC